MYPGGFWLCRRRQKVYEQHNGVWAFGLHGQTSDPGDKGIHLVWASENPELSSKTLS